jgi:uncharacterized protein YbjT (DUF2867 family)
VKVEQEAMIRAARIPATIVRATVFHELLATWARGLSKLGRLLVVRGVMQPVDPRDVAVVVADAVEAQDGADRELAGPEIEPIETLAREYLAARDPGRKVLRLPALGPLRPVADGAYTDATAPRGKIGFAQWLTETH